MTISILLLILVLLACLVFSVMSLRKSVLDLVKEQLALQRAITHEMCPAFGAFELNQQFERVTEYGRGFADLKFSVSPEDTKPPISVATQERMRDVSECFARYEVNLMRFRFMVQANFAVARGHQTIVDARRVADELDDSLCELVRVRRSSNRDEEARYGPTRFGVVPDAQNHLAEQMFRRWFDRCHGKAEFESHGSQSSISATGESLQWVTQYMARHPEISPWIGHSGENQGGCRE